MTEDIGPEEPDHYSDLLPELLDESADDEDYIGPMPEDRDSEPEAVHRPPPGHLRGKTFMQRMVRDVSLPGGFSPEQHP